MRSRSQSAAQHDTAGQDDTEQGQHDGIASAVGSFTHFVAHVRTKTTGRVITAARVIVFALVIAVMAVAAVALLLVGLVRALDVALPRGAWLAHLVAATLSGIVGAVLWRRRKAPRADATESERDE